MPEIQIESIKFWPIFSIASPALQVTSTATSLYCGAAWACLASTCTVWTYLAWAWPGIKHLIFDCKKIYLMTIQEKTTAFSYKMLLNHFMHNKRWHTTENIKTALWAIPWQKSPTINTNLEPCLSLSADSCCVQVV